MATKGFLSYIIKEWDSSATRRLSAQSVGKPLDRCKYANNADETCHGWAFADISGMAMTEEVCGQPWECEFPKDGWSTETQNMCREFFKFWADSRTDYQANHTVMEQQVYTGDYVSEAYNGFCSGPGEENYLPILRNKVPTLERCASHEYIGCVPVDNPPNTIVIAGGAQLNLQVQS